MPEDDKLLSYAELISSQEWSHCHDALGLSPLDIYPLGHHPLTSPQTKIMFCFQYHGVWEDSPYMRVIWIWIWTGGSCPRGMSRGKFTGGDLQY